MQRDIFTTQRGATRIVGRLGIKAPTSILDIGCGEGPFLLAAARELSHQVQDIDDLADQLTGIDLDATAVATARELLTKEVGCPSGAWRRIRRSDGLALDERRKYEWIIGNPPWTRLHHIGKAARRDLRSRFDVAVGSFDLVFVFIEKSLRMLSENGQLALVVPWGIKVQPSAGALRDLLDSAGTWGITRLPRHWFYPDAGVDPALLRLRRSARRVRSSRHGERLMDIAHVSSGVPTGKDAAFLLDVGSREHLGVESSWLKPAVRGRDIYGPNQGLLTKRIIWPYSWNGDAWDLRRFDADASRVRRYLAAHRGELSSRPRLSKAIESDANSWYRMIDPGRYVPKKQLRIAIPDIFHSSRYLVIDDPETVILNTCFQVTPEVGMEERVVDFISSSNFWDRLHRQSRRLSNGWVRTSVSELRSLLLK